MQLKYSGREQVNGTIESVWECLTKPATILQFMPDVVSGEVIDDLHFHAVVKVSAGAVNGQMDFKVELEPNPGPRWVTVRLQGSGLGSSLHLMAHTYLADNRDSTTTVDWVGVATILGLIANVGGRILDAEGECVFRHFFKRLAQTVEGKRPGVTGGR